MIVRSWAAVWQSEVARVNTILLRPGQGRDLEA
jgi:hypothetical protein